MARTIFIAPASASSQRITSPETAAPTDNFEGAPGRPRRPRLDGGWAAQHTIIRSFNHFDVTRRSRRWQRSASALAALILVSVSAGTTPVANAIGPIGEWFDRANEHLTDMMDATTAALVAAKSGSREAIRSTCTKLHDANAALQADMPSPDPNLTRALQAAIDDFDTASHNCLSASQGGGEAAAQQFLSSLADADQHLKEAFDILQSEPASAWEQ